MGKTGPTYVLSSHRAKELAHLIDCRETQDVDLRQLADYLRSAEKFAIVCVAKEDNILWPGGPNIRDYQIGGGSAIVTIVVGDEMLSNQPLEEDDFLSEADRLDLLAKSYADEMTEEDALWNQAQGEKDADANG